MLAMNHLIAQCRIRRQQRIVFHNIDDIPTHARALVMYSGQQRCSYLQRRGGLWRYSQIVNELVRTLRLKQRITETAALAFIAQAAEMGAAMTQRSILSLPGRKYGMESRKMVQQRFR